MRSFAVLFVLEKNRRKLENLGQEKISDLLSINNKIDKLRQPCGSSSSETHDTKMNKIVEIWKYLANEFDDEYLADEILSFSVEMIMNCTFDDFESFPFRIGFPGLAVCLEKKDWKTKFKSCLSMKFICNLNLEGNFIHFQCFFFWRIF